MMAESLADRLEAHRAELDGLMNAGQPVASISALRNLAQLLDAEWDTIVAAVRAAEARRADEPPA